MPQASKGKAQEGIPGSFAKKRSLLPSAVTSITRNMWNKLSSSSQEAHPLMMDESFLPYLLSRDLMFFFVNLPSIKEPPLEWTFWVNFCCWSPSCPLPFFAPSVLLPVGSNIPSRLPSLHLLGQIFFTAITHSSGSFLAGGYSWLSSFLLPSFTLTLQRGL